MYTEISTFFRYHTYANTSSILGNTLSFLGLSNTYQLYYYLNKDPSIQTRFFPIINSIFNKELIRFSFYLQSTSIATLATPTSIF